jgi:excisionase family DNA binding protein
MNKAIFTSTDELAALVQNSVDKAFSSRDGKPKEIEKLFLTLDEACKFLNLAKQTIYGFTSKNEIPFIKRGKKLYFKKEELENWLTQNKNH